jgi:hypothetical protein
MCDDGEEEEENKIKKIKHKPQRKKKLDNKKEFDQCDMLILYILVHHHYHI